MVCERKRKIFWKYASIFVAVFLTVSFVPLFFVSEEVWMGIFISYVIGSIAGLLIGGEMIGELYEETYTGIKDGDE